MPSRTNLLVVLDGAACSLTGGELRERLEEWRALRDRVVQVELTADGALLRLAPDEPVGSVADLIARESACCPFYRFDLRVAGPERTLAIATAPGAEAAIPALLHLEEPTGL
jgi:hypothetical protein